MTSLPLDGSASAAQHARTLVLQEGFHLQSKNMVRSVEMLIVEMVVKSKTTTTGWLSTVVSYTNTGPSGMSSLSKEEQGLFYGGESRKEEKRL